MLTQVHLSTTHGPSSLGYWIIVIATTLSYTVNSGLTPLINRGASTELHTSSMAAGALVASATFTSLVCMVVSAPLTDRFGPRTVCAASQAIAVSALLAPILTLSIQSIIINRLLYGAGNAGITLTTTVWVTRNVPMNQRGRVFGYYGVSVWVGLAVGPVFCESVATIYGIRAAFIGLALLQSISWLLLLCVLGGPIHIAGKSVQRLDYRRTSSFNNKTYRKNSNLWILATGCWIPCLLGVVSWGSEGAVVTFTMQHLQQFGIPSVGVLSSASLFIVLTVFVIAARGVFGSFPDHIGPVPIICISSVILAFGILVLAMARTLFTGAAGTALIGIGYSPMYPALALLVTQRLPLYLHSHGLAMFSASTSVGFYLGSFAA